MSAHPWRPFAVARIWDSVRREESGVSLSRGARLWGVFERIAPEIERHIKMAEDAGKLEGSLVAQLKPRLVSTHAKKIDALDAARQLNDEELSNRYRAV
jgi:hypothetical protein